MDDADIEVGILLGVEGVQATLNSLDDTERALTRIVTAGGSVSSAMQSIADATTRVSGVLKSMDGGADAAAMSLTALRNQAAALNEAYSAIAAANVGATPQQRLDAFGIENVKQLQAAQEALAANAIADYERMNAAARELEETVRRTAAIRQGGYDAVAREQYEAELAALTPLEAAKRRLADATARENAARQAAVSAGSAYASAVRYQGKNSEAAAAAAERHGKALQELARAMGATRQAAATYENALERAERESRQMGDAAHHAEVRVQALQYALFYTSFTLTSFGAAGVAALTSVFKAMIEVESQFAQVNRTVADYSDSTREELLAITRDIPVTIESVAQIAALGGALDVGADQIAGFTKTIAILTATTNLTEQAAGTLLGRMGALLDLNPDGSDFERIGASVLAVGAQSAATETQVSAMAAQVAGLGKNVGLTAPQIIGWSGALASVGVSAELGRSSLQRIFNVLNRDAREGGAALETLGQITGQTGLQFRDALERDASGALLTLVRGLRDFTAAGGDSVQVLNSIGISNVRDVYSLQQLAAAYENTNKVLDISNDAYINAGQTLDDYYGPIAETTASRIQILQSAWQELLVAIGESTQGPFNEAVEGLTTLVRTVNNLVENNPQLVSFVVTLTAILSALALMAGAVALAGSSLANFLFVKQQVIAALQTINAVHLPGFIRNMLIKKGVLDADTVSTQLNAAASERAGLAVQGFGARAATAGRMIASATVALAALAAGFLAVEAVARQVGLTMLGSAEEWEQSNYELGQTNQALAVTTIALNGAAAGWFYFASGVYSALEAAARFLGLPTDALSQWGFETETNANRLVSDNEQIIAGMNGTAEAAEESTEPLQTWADALGESGVVAAEAAGQAEYLNMALEEVPESAVAATEALVALSKGIAQSSGSYLELGNVIERVVDRNKELGDSLAEIMAGGNSNIIGDILAEMTASNTSTARFQENLAAIGRSGNQSLAAALGSMGPEQAASLAETLVGNPELQRQFQVQARIAGLLANEQFVQAFQEGSEEGGLSDAILIELAKSGASMDEVFAAIDAASFGLGSTQWESFVNGWNEANAATPLSLGSFEIAPESAAGTATQAVRDYLAQELRSPQGLVRVDVPITPNFLFDGANSSSGEGAAAYLLFGQRLQSQLDSQTITVPMAFDEIALVNGYESWQAYVEEHPALAEINTAVAPDSIIGLLNYIRSELARETFLINVGSRFTAPRTGQPGVTRQAQGGYIDTNGVGHFAGGGGWGFVRGRGTATSDSIPAWLSNGEYVQPARATSYYGVDMMDAIRARRFPTIDQFAMMMQSAMSVSGNPGPQSVTNVSVTQNYPQTVNPLETLRQDSENLVAGIWGR